MTYWALETWSDYTEVLGPPAAPAGKAGGMKSRTSAAPGYIPARSLRLPPVNLSFSPSLFSAAFLLSLSKKEKARDYTEVFGAQTLQVDFNWEVSAPEQRSGKKKKIPRRVQTLVMVVEADEPVGW